MDIKKRDGRMEPFSKQKIVDAVEAAMAETTRGVNEAVSHLIASTIENACEAEMLPCDVENIQDTVERMLMAQNCFDAAKRYILYRDEHTKTREHNGILGIGNTLVCIDAQIFSIQPPKQQKRREHTPPCIAFVLPCRSRLRGISPGITINQSKYTGINSSTPSLPQTARHWQACPVSLLLTV